MCARKLTARIFEGVSPVLQFDPLLRKADEASERLDKAAASGDPFSVLAAKDAAMRVVNEMAERLNVQNALDLIKSSYSTPQGLFESSPGAAPSLTQSSNAGSAPRGSRVPVTPSAGSTVAPKAGDFPQSSNYGRPDGSDPNIEEQRRYADAADSSDPLENERILEHLKLLNRVDPPRNYSDGERVTMAQTGAAMPDGSLPIGRAMEIPIAINDWQNSGKSAEGRSHIKRRAKDLNAEWILPPEFRSNSAKLALSGRLRKGVYSPEERRAAALSGHALPDGSHVVKDSEDLRNSLESWKASGSPVVGALPDHLKARAKALKMESELPPELKADADKLALAGLLRKR
jgi:hypothetical protein